MVDRFVVMRGQIGIDLRPGAIHHNQANTQTVQQADVVDDTGKVFVFNGFAAEQHDKGFPTMGVDIGNRMAESLDQFDSTLLHHGTTLNEFLFVINVFLFDRGRERKPKFWLIRRNSYISKALTKDCLPFNR